MRYVPEDRIRLGAPAELSVRENLVLRDFMREPVSHRGIVDAEALARVACRRAAAFDVRSTDLDAPTWSLSGGNVQRVVLARELDGDFDVLVAHNPTAGLDIRATRYVRDRIAQCAGRGAAVLLISSDLDEIFELSDTLMVLHRGQSMGAFKKDAVSAAQIAALMAGRARAQPEAA